MMKPQRRRQNLWIESDGGFIGAAWYWPTRIAAGPTAVVLVPGIAHEEQRMNGGLVALAESLAHAGLPALLIDLHGCSQSAGRFDDFDIGACWRADIRAAVQYARDSGAARVIVIGTRLGVPLAIDALAGEPLAALVAWAPIASGRRYVRELKVLQRTTDAGIAGMTAIGGFSFPASVSEHIATLDLAKIDRLAAEHILLLDTADRQDAPWLEPLVANGLAVERQISDQVPDWLFGADDQAALPQADILALTRWCRALHEKKAENPIALAPRRPDQRRSIEFVHGGRLIRETFVEVGPRRMTGVISEPVDGADPHAVRLLMTTVGPGRMFADFARDEASRGKTSLRFDFSGFGTSGRGETVQGGEFYAEDSGSDVLAAIDYLREAGHQRIYAFGFCAGAWAMMRADPAPELRAVVAINVALYREPGPAPSRFIKRARAGRVRLSPALARNRLLRSVAAGVKRAKIRHRKPVEWLTRLCNADVRVLLAYADSDLGLDYLKRRMAKGMNDRLRSPFLLRTYADLGHLADGPSARSQLFRDVTDFFADLDAPVGESDAVSLMQSAP